MSALRKNTAGQYLYFGLVSTGGAAVTGATVTARRSIDGAAQAACTGTVNEKGNGQYELALSQADSNGNDIGFLFTAAGAVPVGFHVFTTAANPSDAAAMGLTNLNATISGIPAALLGTTAASYQVAGSIGEIFRYMGAQGGGKWIVDKTVTPNVLKLYDLQGSLLHTFDLTPTGGPYSTRTPE